MRLCRVCVCLRLCGWWPVTPADGSEEGLPELPAANLARRLSEWLSGPRSRALRRAQIGLCERVLEVGAGHCVVTPELSRRAAGRVISIDVISTFAKTAQIQQLTGLTADGRALPFRDGSFDLVFFQNALLWIDDYQVAIAEAARVLAPDGSLVAIEPDYGGMIEHPDLGLKRMWMAGLTAAGADPLIGRKLPAACGEHLDVHVELAHLPRKAEPEAVKLLSDLPLNEEDRQRLGPIMNRLEASTGWQYFLHVPYFLIVAEKT